MRNPIPEIKNHVRRHQVAYAAVSASVATMVWQNKRYEPYMRLGSAGLKFISDQGMAEQFVKSLPKK